MSRPLWFVNFIKKIYPARFGLARLTRFSAVRKIVDVSLFNHDDIVYLPKDNVVRLHAPIARPEETVLPSQVVEHFIEQSSYRFIMNFCICREGDGCQDYPADLGCLFLGEAVLGINPKLGRLVSKEAALEHMERCREAGLVHMVGRNKLDTVWLGVQPGHRLLTICNCCPCCCLFKVAPHLHADIGKKIHRMAGVTVNVNGGCSGCGLCTEGVCFVEAISLENGRARIGEGCRGCGRCVEICPNEAIELHVAGDASVQSTIAALSDLVDLG